MRRDENSNIEHAGQDSFLDVTTNIVGVLIILVMVVGMRAQNPIVQASSTPPTTDELQSLAKQAVNVEYDVRRMGQEIASIDQEAAAKSEAREALATMIAAAQKDLDDSRAKLDAGKQEDFDLRRQVEENLADVDREQAELKQLESQKGPVIEVHHYPTPISRMVSGHEAHFQLSRGRISYVPIDEFVEDVRSDMRGSVDFGNLEDKVSVVGPRHGFEFRYTMAIVSDHGRVVGIRAKEFQVVPVGGDEGETLPQALDPKSEFHHVLAMHSPHDTTVTMWTYPDSFETYRQLKEELHRLGFATAGRPLPMGVLIGGSDHGTKSSAQ
jgi:hypothetical protein